MPASLGDEFDLLAAPLLPSRPDPEPPGSSGSPKEATTDGLSDLSSAAADVTPRPFDSLAPAFRLEPEPSSASAPIDASPPSATPPEVDSGPDQVAEPTEWWDDDRFSPSALVADPQVGHVGGDRTVQPRLPTLPPAAAVPTVPHGGGGARGGYASATVPLQQFQHHAASGQRRGRLGVRIVRALLLVAVTVAAGVGAGLGWVAYEQRQDDAAGPAEGSGRQAFESLAAVAGRPAASRVEVSLDAPARTMLLRTDLDTADLVFELVEQLPDGPRRVQFERVGDASVVREWTPAGWIETEDHSVQALADAVSAAAPHLVLTLGDVAPPALHDHVTVLAHDRPVLGEVDPIASAQFADTELDDTSVGGDAVRTDHFLLSIDTHAVATADPAGFDRWRLVDRLGIEPAQLEPLVVDVWVDEFGVVRRMIHGGEVTTLHRLDDRLLIDGDAL